MKTWIFVATFAAATLTAAGCKSRAKTEAPVVPAEALITPDMTPVQTEPITPADLGATSSGLGL